MRTVKRASLAGALLLGVCACRESGHRDQKTLRMALFSEPPSLDPQLADTGVSIFLLNQLVSTLLTYDSERRLIPYDAESYEWKSEGRELRVILRAGLAWSDGVPLSACQYRDGILRALDPKTPAALAELLFDIQNARERKQGKMSAKQVRLLCSDSERSLRLFTVRPYPARLLHALAFVVSAPVRLDRIRERSTEWLFPSTGGSVGLSSGAFVLKEWSRGRKLILQGRQVSENRLPEDRRALLETVELPLLKDPSAGLALYEKGEIDVLTELPHAWLSKAAERKDLQSFPYFTTYMVGFAPKKAPALRDARVRRALALAFESAEIPQLLGGQVEEARGWIPPGLLTPALRKKTARFDPRAARKLMSEAGYPGGKGFPVLPLFYNTGERHQLLMERMSYNWKKYLGIRIELNPMEWKVLVSRLKAHPPALYRYAWAAVYPDPLFFLEIFSKDNPNNFSEWFDEEYEKLLATLEQVPYGQRDGAFWKNIERAENILLEKNPAFIPVYHYKKNVLIAPKVQGLSFDWRGGTLLRQAVKIQER